VKNEGTGATLENLKPWGKQNNGSPDGKGVLCDADDSVGYLSCT
jgi:hypothetical protein